MTTLLAPFQYRQPETLDEVFQCVDELANEKRSFIFSGGGTDVISLLKQKLNDPQTVISLSRVGALKRITMLPSGKLQIGALASLTRLINDRSVQELVPAIAAAAEKVASPQIRNQATIGGNILVTNRCIYFNQSELNRDSHIPCFKADGDICHLVKGAKREKLPLCRARFVSDTVPVLLLLDAELVVAGARGERRVGLKDLYLPDGIYCRDIQPDEVLAFIEIDVSRKKAIHYEKLAARNPFDFPSLGVAVGIESADEDLNSENVVLSVAVTGVHTHPAIMTHRSDEYSSPTQMVASACREAARNVVTFQQDQFPRDYRKKMVEVYIRRGIKQLTGDLWI